MAMAVVTSVGRQQRSVNSNVVIRNCKKTVNGFNVYQNTTIKNGRKRFFSFEVRNTIFYTNLIVYKFQNIDT